MDLFVGRSSDHDATPRDRSLAQGVSSPAERRHKKSTENGKMRYRSGFGNREIESIFDLSISKSQARKHFSYSLWTGHRDVTARFIKNKYYKLEYRLNLLDIFF